ncbi:MAG: EI24 domain-containing protein [Rhodospirillales bacterium]|nr:EI24 domain-containing protein [Rhodospirillales bacterium]
MIKAFIKAAQQISDPRARRVIWIALAAAAGVFILLWILIGFLLANTALFSIGWLETAIDWLGGLATGVLTWLLFPAAISAVIGLFLEDIASAVEDRHYPDLGPALGSDFSDTVLTTVRFLAIMLSLNILMLPFLLTGPLFPFVFYSVNGYLLSREYFELVALRRMGRADARALRKRYAMKLFMTGVIIAFLLTVPIVNLLAPIIATGMMVHLFEDFRAHA